MRSIALIACSLFLLCVQLCAQDRIITGNVLDEKGNPIPLVSVSVEGVPKGVTTGEDGSFRLSIRSNTKKLIFSSIGYLSEEISLGVSDHITIVLQINRRDEAWEVIVTGYSRIKRSEYAGAATVVRKEDINEVPVANFDEILQGRAPGLLVTTGSGQPGEESATKVQIRGQGSIAGSSDPLYILDGMAIEAENFRSLNPADFENIQVLRDAVATAQYGNRGSSGVIVITTKKGRAGKSILSYSGQTGITQAGKQPFAMANSAQLLQVQEDIGLQIPGVLLPGWVYSKKNPVYASLPLAVQAQYDQTLDSFRNINTDWKDIFERQGQFARHDLSLSGGTENTRFYLAGGYYKEDGIGLNSDLTRYTFRANLDHQSNRLTLNLSSGMGYTSSDFINSENLDARANEFAAVYLAPTYEKLYNPDGSVAVGPGNTGPNAYDLQVNANSIKEGQIKADLALRATYDITKNIYLGGSMGLDYRQTTTTNTIYPNTYVANNSPFPIGPGSGDSVGHGEFGTGIDNYFEYVVRALGGFRKRFDGKHDVDIQVVSEFTKDHQDGFSYTGYGIDPNLLNTPAGVTQGTPTNLLIANTQGQRQERALYAAMLLGRYTYLDQYTLNLSFRRDATSQLAPDKRFQSFYSAGLNWDALAASFARTWTGVNNLNLRLSYGESANSDHFISGDYGYLPGYTASTYAGRLSVLPSPALPGNPDLSWERIKTWNAGIDFGFFKNRISGSLDLYHKATDGDIIPQQLSYTSGYASQSINAGTVVNKGIEMAVNVDILRFNSFRWSVGANVSYNHNDVTSLGQAGTQFQQGAELVKVGVPLGSYYAVKWAGVDAATGQPLYYDKNGKITNVYSSDNNTTGFGTLNAPWIGGFNTGLSYKGFFLGAFFTFQEGFHLLNNQDFFLTNTAYAVDGFNVRTSMLNMWQKPGDVTDVQNATTLRNISSKDVQDASYLRFRNLTLAYTLNNKVLERTKVFSVAKVFVQAENLYTWTQWVGLDPENSSNLATFNYPLPRTYTLGLSFSFN